MRRFQVGDLVKIMGYSRAHIVVGEVPEYYKTTIQWLYLSELNGSFPSSVITLLSPIKIE